MKAMRRRRAGPSSARNPGFRAGDGPALPVRSARRSIIIPFKKLVTAHLLAYKRAQLNRSPGRRDA